jgi:thioredoxin reductase
MRELPARVASWDKEILMKICDVAIVGSGPNGLSIAAHLQARGLNYRIFGKPMDSWAAHMPEGMMLKSDGFVSNLSSPVPGFTLEAYCRRNNIPYAPEGLPIPLKTFVQYAQWFRESNVPHLDSRMVAKLDRNGDLFTLTLEDGEVCMARHVVLAAGITWYAYTPEVFAPLSRDMLSHSFGHRDVTRFKGKDVAIIGAGSSAINLGDALHQAGANPVLVARKETLEFNRVPDAADSTLIRRIQAPASGIGRGWKSYFCAYAPSLFYRLPQHLKDRAIASHMHPAGGFYMRDKIEGVVATSLGRSIKAAAMHDGRAVLTLAKRDGTEETASFDHVITATGFNPDFHKLPFLTKQLAERAAPGGGAPDVSDVFETKADGLYAVGLSAMRSFGPLMRFMMGSDFTAPHLAAHFERTLAATRTRRAA